MMADGASRRQIDWLSLACLLGCGIVGSTMIVAGSRHVGATFDEPFYLRQGLEHWRTGSRFELLRQGTMPLPVDVQTLPVYAWERVRGRVWDLETEFADALAVARVGNLVFYWLVLVYGGRIARGIAGPWAGRLAVAVLALEPNLLAHAGLATTDVGLAACLLLFAYHYNAGRDKAWRQRVGLPALFCGLALLAKASALAFVPICILAIDAGRLWSRSSEERFVRRCAGAIRGLLARRFLMDCAVIGVGGLALAYLYCGSDWQPHPHLIHASHAMPDGPMKPAAVWLAEHLTIFNNAGVALWFQIKHNVQGHGVYLLGATAERSIWYYFPATLSMKLAAPVLIAPLALLVVSRRSLANWACLAALLLLAFSLNCRVQIGVRMQLPLIMLAIVGISAATVRAVSDMSGWRRGAAVGVTCASVAWMATSTASVWPDSLCYINEIWGGPERGEQLLSDSNFDWGQGLPELDEWRRDRGLSEISIWYFGTDPAALHPPFHNVPLHAMSIPDAAALRREVPTRYLAVGTTILYGSYITEPDWLLTKLRSQEPVGRTRTFFIYDVSELTDTNFEPGNRERRTENRE